MFEEIGKALLMCSSKIRLYIVHKIIAVHRHKELYKEQIWKVI